MSSEPGRPGAAGRAVATMTGAGLTVAVAESLTGGALTARLVDVPGASAVLRGGVVAYATDLKAGLLGVSERLLADVGPVDPLVATQMAEGVRLLLGADLALATTGVAGPTPQSGQPPGTVHVALAWDGGHAVRSAHVPGTRTQVRGGAVDLALDLLLERLALPPFSAGTVSHADVEQGHGTRR